VHGVRHRGADQHKETLLRDLHDAVGDIGLSARRLSRSPLLYVQWPLNFTGRELALDFSGLVPKGMMKLPTHR
jgi:hypothetical protein